MAFSPFARFRNFTLNNLKAILELYPDMSRKMSWSEAGDIIGSKAPGYKKTAYQQACQFGIEDRGRNYFRIHDYLFAFEDENLIKYLEFWLKTYYAPNPYVKDEGDKPFLIYCEIVKCILTSSDLEINYNDFFNERIGGKSKDILLNAINSYASPVQYKHAAGNDILFISMENRKKAEEEIKFIETEFQIINAKDKKTFFDHYNYANFCKFHGITLTLESIQNEEAERETGGANILLYGVPGAGKSHVIKTRYCSDPYYIERLVFHPDYTYSDFVGQILPRVIKGDKTSEGRLEYLFIPGPFTRILKKAEKDPGNRYYLIIEEINRGNAPAIFGEIFQLLDRKEDGTGDYGISNYDVALEVYNDESHEVRIPSNLFLLATMNTSDQNVFTLDTAFQRRWNMKHIENNVMAAEHADHKIAGTNISWGVFASIINGMIVDISAEMASSEDKRLGAYFVRPNELDEDKFPQKVLKFLWDDAFKMEKDSVFKEEYKSLEDVITTYTGAAANKLSAVLRTEVYNKMIAEMDKKAEENEIRTEEE